MKCARVHERPRLSRGWKDDVFPDRDGVMDAMVLALSAPRPIWRAARIPAIGEVK